MTAAATLRTMILPTSTPLLEGISNEGDDLSARIAALNKEIGEAQSDLNQRKKDGADPDLDEEAGRVAKKLQETRAALSGSGPPAPALFAAFLELIAENAPQQHKEAIQAAILAMTDQPPDVAICRLEGCVDKQITKLVWGCRDYNIDKAVIAGILASEPAAKLMRGTQAPGYLEDDLSNWIQASRLVA